MSKQLNDKIPRAREFTNPFDLRVSTVPAEPGLYWLWSDKSRLYVGESDNLLERLEVQFAKEITFDFWGEDRSNLKLAFRPVVGVTSPPRHQSKWICDWRPIGNYRTLAALG